MQGAVLQDDGQSGGAGTQVSPGSQAQCREKAVGASESPQQTPPLEPDHLTSHVTNSLLPAPTVAAPPKFHSAHRTHPARSEQGQHLATVFTPRRNGAFHPLWGNQVLLRVSGLAAAHAHRGALGVVCSLRQGRDSKSCRRHDHQFGPQIERGVGAIIFL